MRTKLARLAATLLDPAQAPWSLRAELLELAAACDGLATATPATLDIGEGGRDTPDGLAISPTMAAMCAQDISRTVVFQRAVVQAVEEAAAARPAGTVCLLYAGCGPWATLVLPLLLRSGGPPVSVDLLELQPDSLASAIAVLEGLGVGDRVGHREEGDAARWRVPEGREYDVIVTEVMQAALEKEPQVAVTRKLVGQLPGARLVPRRVQVEMVLTDPGREFATDGGAGSGRDRVELGCAFALDREAVATWSAVEGQWLPGAALVMPASIEPRYQPMLFTRIEVGEGLWLREYDSGLTGPRLLDLGRGLRGGERVRFRYRLGEGPGLEVEVLGVGE